jgi:hypothetical protein
MKFGGGDSSVLNEYHKKLTFIFDEMAKKEYTKEIEQFHVELRVDGEYLQFGDPEGCNNLRLYKKRHLIANSISFGKNIYDNENTLHQFLKTNTISAFSQIIKRLEKEKMSICGESLVDDLNKYIDEYL